MAISSLPSKERQVIELMLKGLPIDSTDGNVLTIAKAVGCTEKTVPTGVTGQSQSSETP